MKKCWTVQYSCNDDVIWTCTSFNPAKLYEKVKQQCFDNGFSVAETKAIIESLIDDDYAECEETYDVFTMYRSELI